MEKQAARAPDRRYWVVCLLQASPSRPVGNLWSAMEEIDTILAHRRMTSSFTGKFEVYEKNVLDLPSVIESVAIYVQVYLTLIP